MTEFFLKIVNMSIAASWIVLAVLLLRFVLKKAPKWITVLLWGIVAVRLICPFNFESVMSLIPSAETVSPEIMMDTTPEINSGIPIFNNTINPVISESFAPDPATSANPLQILIPVLAMVWIIGVVAMLAYTVVSYLRVKRKIGTAVLLKDNIYQSESVVSPFVLGIVRPKIYLPFGMNEQDMEHVIAHEQAHIKRKDHWWKPLGFLILAIHWFNPLVWLGYVLLCRDIELACDEKVVKDFDKEQKADYSQALLTCSVNRRMIAACPLAFGEVGVKGRVKSVLNYKKPAFWIILIAIVVSVVVAVCFLTNPASNTLENIEFLNFEHRRQNTVSVLVSDGETYTPVGAVRQDLLKELCDIKISKNEVSRNRSEDRDKTHTLVLQTAKNIEPAMYSSVDGWHIHFDSTFSSVWVNNGVKPTLSYRVINPQKAKQIYEDIANFVGAEKLTWTYNPMLSYTAHYTKAFNFDFDYTHVEGSCSEGEFCSLDVEGQPSGTKMRFENGTTVYWTPTEGVNEKLPQKSEVTLAIYNDDILLHKCVVVFECVSRDAPSAEFEIYLKTSDGLRMVSYGDGIKLVEESSVSNIGGVDGPTNVVTVDVDKLKEKFPNYFDLSTTKGLVVYVWQMAEGSYSCGLLSGKNLGYTQEELWDLHKTSATLDEMRAIVADYIVNGGVPRNSITIQAIVMPHSSYAYTINDEYREKLNNLFWSVIPIVENTKYNPVIDTATFDIDGDGKDEQCSISYGPTSGLFTFKLSVTENGRLEYFNIYNGLPGDMSFVTTADGTKLHLLPQGETNPIDYSFSVKDGNIVLTANGENVAYWGEQGIGSTYAPKTIGDSNDEQ